MSIAVISWGRMNPVTVGHEKVVNFLKQKAKEVFGTPLLFVSHTHDKNKNPLPYDFKIKILRMAFGKIVQKSEHKTIFDVLLNLSTSYSKIILVVGQDRKEEFEQMMKRFVPSYFDVEYEIISAGNRNESSSIEGISGSKMRHFVCINNYNMFKYYLPTKIKPMAREIFRMIKDNDQEEQLDEYVLNYQQRYKRALSMRRHGNKIELARERLARRPADLAHLKRRARMKAIQILKQKFVGGSGAKYADLSIGQKIQVDQRLDKRKNLIARLAARLLNKVRQADHERLHNLSDHKTVREEDVNTKFEMSTIINESFENLFEDSDEKTKTKYDNLLKHRTLKDFHKKMAGMYAARANRSDKDEVSLKKAEEHEEAMKAHEQALIFKTPEFSKKAHKISTSMK